MAQLVWCQAVMPFEKSSGARAPLAPPLTEPLKIANLLTHICFESKNFSYGQKTILESFSFLRLIMYIPDKSYLWPFQIELSFLSVFVAYRTY